MNGEERLRVRARSDRYVHRRDAGDESFRLLSAASMSADDVPALLDEIDRLTKQIKSIEAFGSAEALRAEGKPFGEQFRADVETVLNQRNLHSHTRPGIWDPDNRPGIANTPCVECAARLRLWWWMATAEGSAEGGTSKDSSTDVDDLAERVAAEYLADVPTEGGAHP